MIQEQGKSILQSGNLIRCCLVSSWTCEQCIILLQYLNDKQLCEPYIQPYLKTLNKSLQYIGNKTKYIQLQGNTNRHGE